MPREIEIKEGTRRDKGRQRGERERYLFD